MHFSRTKDQEFQQRLDEESKAGFMSEKKESGGSSKTI